MKTKHNGISLDTACQAIADHRDKLDRMYSEHQQLIQQAIKQFEFATYEEFIQYFIGRTRK